MAAALMVAFVNVSQVSASELKKVDVAWCVNGLQIVLAPWAVAKKFGWLEEEGLDVQLVNVASGADCVKFLATGQFPYAQPGIEPVAALVEQNADLEVFYTQWNGTPWGVAVPEDSAIQTVADLKGKKIGVLSLASNGAYILKGLLREAGLDPDRDVSLIAVGEAPRAALFLKNGEIDAVSIFDIVHLYIGTMGVPLREIESKSLAGAPSLVLAARKDYLAENTEEAVSVARAYSKGAAFTYANPEAAAQIFYEIYPQSLPAGKTWQDVWPVDKKLLERRAAYALPENHGLSGFGASNIERYNEFLAFLQSIELIKSELDASTFVRNDLIEEINAFDRSKIEADAAAYRQ